MFGAAVVRRVDLIRGSGMTAVHRGQGASRKAARQR